MSANANDVSSSLEAEAMEDAAVALRATDIEAAQEVAVPKNGERLEELSIDDLRKLAAKLNVPDREQIVEQDKLIRAIRRCR